MLTGILYFLLIGSVSFYLAGKWTRDPLEKAVSFMLLIWSVQIVTALLLSAFHALRNPVLYLLISLALLCLAFLIMPRRSRQVNTEANWDIGGKFAISEWLMLGGLVAITLLNLVAIVAFSPNNHDSLAYHLPRIHFYLSQGHLGHFYTTDQRQVFFPFNPSLLQLPVVLFSLPDRLLSLYNLLAWILIGGLIFAIAFRLCKNRKASILSAFLGLTGTCVLAQSCTTNNDILLALPLLSALYFLLRWIDNRRSIYILFLSISVGIALGTKVTIAYFLPGLLLFLLLRYRRPGLLHIDFQRYIRPIRIPVLILSCSLVVILGAPSYLINLRDASSLSAPSQAMYINHPWNTNKAHINCFAIASQAFLNPVSMSFYNLFRITDPILGTAYKHSFAYYANQQLHEKWIGKTWHNDITSRYPSYVKKPISSTPVEDEVWYGLPFFIILILAIILPWKRHKLVSFLSLLVLSFVISYGLLMNWQPWSSRFFLPAYLLASCGAGYAYTLWKDKKKTSTGKPWIYQILILGILFNAFSYQINNYRRGIHRLFNDKYRHYTLSPDPIEELSSHQKVYIVRPEAMATDQAVYHLLRYYPGTDFIQQPAQVEEQFNIIALPENSLCADHLFLQKLGFEGLNFLAKHDYYWYSIEETCLDK